MTGYSLGQVVVWKIENTVLEHNNLSLVPLLVLENSKEEPIQFAYFGLNSLYFNWGHSFIQKTIHSNYSDKNSDHALNLRQNIKIHKGKHLIE